MLCLVCCVNLVLVWCCVLLPLLSIVQDNANYFIPQAWQRCQAVEWSPSSTTGTVSGSSGRQALPADTSGAGPSPLLIFNLWRDILGSASQEGLRAVASLPLLPVVVGTGTERVQMLVSATFAAALLNTSTASSSVVTAVEEESRLQCTRETGRLKSLLKREGEAISKKINALSRFDAMELYATPGDDTKSAGEDGGGESKESHPDEVSASASSNLPPPPPSAQATSLDTAGNQRGSSRSMNNGSRINGNTPASTPTPAPASASASVSLDVYSSPQLEQALQVLRLPQLDGSLLSGPPQAIHESAERAPALFGGANFLGHKILHCLQLIHRLKVKVFKASEGQGLVEGDSLLSFEKLTQAQRKVVLLEFLAAHHSRALTPGEIAGLKSLPLFTSRDGSVLPSLGGGDDSQAGAGAGAGAGTGGIYWCESDAALAGLAATYDTFVPTTTSTDTDAGDGSGAGSGGGGGAPLSPQPVVLLNDRELREIYQLVGAEELTPSVVVRKFTLASLGRMQGSERVRVMRGLSEQWSNYQGDNELVALLKRVAFIPSWVMSAGGAGERAESDEVILDLAQYRTPEVLFSWRNEALVETLQGPTMASYFAPPSMRTEQWHAMLTDLGMQAELDKTSTARIAQDIENAASMMEENGEGQKVSVGGGGGGEVERSGQHCHHKSPAERGRALLRYLRDDDRVFLFDAILCRSLKSIRFVPARVPLRVESAGFVVLKASEVCSFDQLLSVQKGHLGFTVMPVLDGDISPPQVKYACVADVFVKTILSQLPLVLSCFI